MRKAIFLFIFCCLYYNIQAQHNDKLYQGLFTIKLEKLDLEKAKIHGISANTINYLRKLMDGQRYGSGFLYQGKDGQPYIITCAHVIEMAKAQYGSITAKDGLGNQYTVETLAADTFYDIAVLKFSKKHPPKNHYNYTFHSAKAQIREKIFALGNVRGGDPNTTMDVTVSKREDNFKNDIGGYGYTMVKGNLKSGMSGGPVVNSKNKVVGITSRAKLYKGSYDDFSVILDGVVAKKIVDELIFNKKRIPRAFLGIVFQQQYDAKKINAKSTVTIKDVVPYAPFHDVYGNDHNGNTIIQINQTPIKNIHDVYKALEKVRYPAVVQLYVTDKNKKQHVLKVKTKALDDDAYELITDHYFDNHPTYFLLDETYGDDILKTQFIHKKKIGTTHYTKESEIDLDNAYPFQVAGYGDGDDKLYYKADDKVNLGKIIKLHSELGQFRVKDIINNKSPKAIRNLPDKDFGRYILKVLYY